jgi:hypothetical protein
MVAGEQHFLPFVIEAQVTRRVSGRPHRSQGRPGVERQVAVPDAEVRLGQVRVPLAAPRHQPEELLQLIVRSAAGPQPLLHPRPPAGCLPEDSSLGLVHADQRP